MKTTRRHLLYVGAATGALVLPFGRLTHADPAVIPSVEDEHYRLMRDKFLEMGAKGMRAGRSPGRRITLYVGARWLTDPDRIARMLPPPLEPDDPPVVAANWLVITRSPGQESVLSPGPAYSESDVSVAAKYRGHRGMLNLQLNLERDLGRFWGREAEGLRKKDGTVYINRYGNTVRAHVARRGEILCALETEVTDEPAHPINWPREGGYGGFKYTCRLHPDWRKGPLHPGCPVQLYLIGGFDEEYPTGWPEPKGFEHLFPRACDLSKTKLHVGGLPYSEFPVRELLGVSLQGMSRLPDTGQQAGDDALSLMRLRMPRGDTTTPALSARQLGRWGYLGLLLEEFDPKDFQPWAFTIGAYDQPISKGKVWGPSGWPERASLLKLDKEHLDRYRSREALELNPVELVDIQYAVDSATVAKTLPPPCKPGDSPLVRIMTLKVEQSDVSTRPFMEIWLLVRCEVSSKPAWYALSHIVSWDGDVINGRETFGYPSKLGDPQIVTDGARYTILGRRLNRDFFRAVVPVGIGAPVRHDETFDLCALQTFLTVEPPRADLVRQPWRIVIDEARHTDPAMVDVALPRTSGPGHIGFSDPWFELLPERVVSVLTGRGAVDRFPGQMVAHVPEFVPYITERWDGFSGESTARASFIEPRPAPGTLLRYGREFNNDRMKTE